MSKFHALRLVTGAIEFPFAFSYFSCHTPCCSPSVVSFAFCHTMLERVAIFGPCTHSAGEPDDGVRLTLLANWIL
jgi:hypothetical protein